MPELGWFNVLLLIWVAITCMLMGLLLYRSLISMKEDDQLFLDPAEAMLEAEQKEVLAKLERLRPYTKGLGFISGALLVIIAGIWSYRAVQQFSNPTLP